MRASIFALNLAGMRRIAELELLARLRHAMSSRASVARVPIDRYSMGMRRKLAIAEALRLDRSILILDQPLGGLEPESNELLGQVLRALSEAHVAVLLTANILESPAAICDRVHLLERGAIAGSFAPAEFPALRALPTVAAVRRLDVVRPFLRDTASGC